MRLIFPARLYFASQLGPDEALALVESQHRECVRWLEEIQSNRRPGEEDDFFVDQIDQYRAGQIEAMLNWLGNLRDTISG